MNLCVFGAAFFYYLDMRCGDVLRVGLGRKYVRFFGVTVRFYAKCVRYFDFACEFGPFACGFFKIRANSQLSPNYFAFLVSKLVSMRDQNPINCKNERIFRNSSIKLINSSINPIKTSIKSKNRA